MTEEIKFEKALERLEKIVEDLESGNISLEDALKRYEEGVKLARTCQERLSQAEKKIEVLTRTLNGSVKKVPFEPETGSGESEEAAPRKRVRKSASSQEASENKDLLF